MIRLVLAAALVGLVEAITMPGAMAGSCPEDMKIFTATWNGASPQHRTAAASRHYAAAQAAQKAKNDRECMAQLRMAADAMK